MTNAIITAYCACRLCCGPDAAGITACGARPVQGITVAAPRSVPFGTRIWIAGVGWRTAQDRTARRYDGRYDVYFARHADALNFGIRKSRVLIDGGSR
jgi:3D (Asp-Asp-Asp) domain-containing protein